MKFNKKPIGDILNRSYIWISRSGDLDFIVYQNNESYLFYFKVLKEGEPLYDSGERGLSFKTAEAAFSGAETWNDG